MLGTGLVITDLQYIYMIILRSAIVHREGSGLSLPVARMLSEDYVSSDEA